MTGLELRIQGSMEDMNATERRIAQYMIDYPHHILRMPIAQLASQVGSSQAAIVRFCKRVGFEGLKDTKAALAEALLASAGEGKDKEEDSYSDIKVSDSPMDVVSKVAANHILAIEETAKALDIAQFQQAVDVLIRAKRIDVFGVGASGLVARDMQQKLTRIGKICMNFPDVHMQLTAAASLTENDAVVLVSYSGKTRDVLDLLSAAKDRGARTIALTKIGVSPLLKQADIGLQVCSSEISIRSGATSSRITQLAVVDMLFTNVAGQQYDQSQEILKRSRAYSAKGKV